MPDLNEIKASLSVTILRVADSTTRKMELKNRRTKNKVDGSVRWEGRAIELYVPFGTQKMCIYNNPAAAAREINSRLKMCCC